MSNCFGRVGISRIDGSFYRAGYPKAHRSPTVVLSENTELEVALRIKSFGNLVVCSRVE